MLVATVFALWGTDAYEVINPDLKHDFGLYVTVFLCFIAFVFEFCVMLTCKDGYAGSFFCWLDLLACLSLLPDVMLLFGAELLSGSSGSLTVARAGRAARAGTRAARIVRVIKLLTLIKRGREKPEDEELKESKIGGQLADLITQKVIVIVGAMLISTSLLDLIATTSDYSFLAELENLENIVANYAVDVPAGIYNATFSANVYHHFFAKFIIDHDSKKFGEYRDPASHQLLREEMGLQQGEDWPAWPNNWLTDNGRCRTHALRHVRVLGNDLWCSQSNYDDLRSTPSEREIYETKNGSRMVLTQINYARGQAVVNIVQILFIVALLGMSSALFNRDAEALVIRPLSKMAALVRKMTENPLAEIDDTGDAGEYETDFVESALKKFGKLLQVAFGEAGAEIIASNMSNGGDLNLMMAGRKLDSIFGFCVIFHFSECTECLQEDIMTFVNQAADYVHQAVNQYEGFTNKNIGEAWLLAWRMPQDGNLAGFTRADSALKSFIRIALQTTVCPKLRQMTEHPKIQEKIPGYTIDMGFGLHVGWAIQGAIGSALKIDASFLSPNVNMASRLEAATKQFYTRILMSGQFFALLSSDVQQLCRKIDRVTVKGSIEPLELWTYDTPFGRYETMKELDIDPTQSYWEQFAPLSTAPYRARFHVAVEHYLAGRWPEAREVLDECLKDWPKDGPGTALRANMGKFNFQAPAGWPGYRELTDK